MGRVLGLDVGTRRIGVAISTPEGTLAVPLHIIERRSDDSDAATIANLARSEGAEALVVGLPRSLNGTIGPQAREVEAFARGLAAATGLELHLQDERLSTVQAERRPTRGKHGKRVRSDDVAAAIILQRFLDRQRGGTGPASS